MPYYVHIMFIRNGNCQTDNVGYYRATVTDNNQNITMYTGLTRNTFKQTFDGHKLSSHQRAKKSTTLLTHLRDNQTFYLKFEI